MEIILFSIYRGQLTEYGLALMCAILFSHFHMLMRIGERSIVNLILIGAMNFHIKYGSCNKPYTSFNGISTKGENVVQDPIIVVATKQCSCIGQY